MPQWDPYRCGNAAVHSRSVRAASRGIEGEHDEARAAGAPPPREAAGGRAGAGGRRRTAGGAERARPRQAGEHLRRAAGLSAQHLVATNLEDERWHGLMATMS